MTITEAVGHVMAFPNIIFLLITAAYFRVKVSSACQLQRQHKKIPSLRAESLALGNTYYVWCLAHKKNQAPIDA
ncbi:hypothetical protein ID852_17205 [Xenorhabdus sp. 42]|uniref:hypothetical protein n=1 Tax=Xenorhabdus szentirmaii TaxID=290112 RepID=UPI0019CD5942|nr:hypothetical protein [Xenorhabdus sp. 42]MBD2822388.1 hypothetical protein [Xenorhabdus sp. 42]